MDFEALKNCEEVQLEQLNSGGKIKRLTGTGNTSPKLVLVTHAFVKAHDRTFHIFRASKSADR